MFSAKVERMNDAELLRSYRETGSEDAFRELVARHLGMVYATALGKVRNPDCADESCGPSPPPFHRLYEMMIFHS